MIQVNRIYLIFNRLVTKKFLVDTSDTTYKSIWDEIGTNSMCNQRINILSFSNNQLFGEADTCTITRLIPTEKT